MTATRVDIVESFPFVAIGCIIEKEGKVLLVQEGQECVRGQWNQPAGWLEKYEDPAQGAKREGEEETGMLLEITDFLGVYSFVKNGNLFQDGIDRHVIKLIFVAKIIPPPSGGMPPLGGGTTGEIMDVRWFSPEEIYAMDTDTLRDEDIKDEVRDYFEGKRYPLDIVRHFYRH